MCSRSGFSFEQSRLNIHIHLNALYQPGSDGYKTVVELLQDGNESSTAELLKVLMNREYGVVLDELRCHGVDVTVPIEHME